MRTTISVVVPTRNRTADLSAALESIREQSVPPDELIVVDDASETPVTEEIFFGFPGSVKCRLLHNQVAVGGGRARNQGVHAASGSHIAFLDDDDEFRPHKVRELYRAIDETNAQLLTSWAHVDVNGRFCYTIKPYDYVDYEAQLLRNCVGGTPMVCVERKFFLDVGGFDEDLPARQDYEAWLRMLKSRAKYHCLENVLVHVKMRFSTASVSKSVARNEDAMAIIEDRYVDDLRALSPDQNHVRQMAIMTFMSHKHLICGDNIGAARRLIIGAVRYRKLKLFLGGLLSVLGRNVFFYVYTRNQ